MIKCKSLTANTPILARGSLLQRLNLNSFSYIFGSQQLPPSQPYDDSTLLDQIRNAFFLQKDIPEAQLLAEIDKATANQAIHLIHSFFIYKMIRSQTIDQAHKDQIQSQLSKKLQSQLNLPKSVEQNQRIYLTQLSQFLHLQLKEKVYPSQLKATDFVITKGYQSFHCKDGFLLELIKGNTIYEFLLNNNTYHHSILLYKIFKILALQEFYPQKEIQLLISDHLNYDLID